MIKTLLKELALPLLLIGETIICLSFGHLIPEEIKAGLYALSLTIKDILLFVLPFLIFSFLSSSLGNLQKGALSFILIALGLVIVSNFFGASLASLSGIFILNLMDTVRPFAESQVSLSPLWNLNIPPLLSNDTALIAGLVFGLVAGYLGNPKIITFINTTQRLGILVLKRAFIPIIPIFVLGFILKMDFDGILDVIVQDYLSVFLAITVLAFTYIILLYGLAAGFRPTPWRRSVQRMVPALITGFSTMSSASALPLITTAAERTTRNPIVNGVVPLSINIHMIGDCFSITIMALAILTSFGLPIPSVSEFLMYLTFFTIARFSAAGVPGGGVIVVLPILETYLGFSPEMLSLILALYILFDPIATSANVFGNGAFAVIFERIYNRLHPVDKSSYTVDAQVSMTTKLT